MADLLSISLHTHMDSTIAGDWITSIKYIQEGKEVSCFLVLFGGTHDTDNS